MMEDFLIIEVLDEDEKEQMVGGKKEKEQVEDK